MNNPNFNNQQPIYNPYYMQPKLPSNVGNIVLLISSIMGSIITIIGIFALVIDSKNNSFENLTKIEKRPFSISLAIIVLIIGLLACIVSMTIVIVTKKALAFKLFYPKLTLIICGITILFGIMFLLSFTTYTCALNNEYVSFKTSALSSFR